jgi:hypothetical protein
MQMAGMLALAIRLCRRASRSRLSGVNADGVL